MPNPLKPPVRFINRSVAVSDGLYALDCAAILMHVAAWARGRSSVLTKVYWSRLRILLTFLFYSFAADNSLLLSRNEATALETSMRTL